jgi:hypothetical protein
VGCVRARAALIALLLTGSMLLGGAFYELRHVDTTLQAAVAHSQRGDGRV